MIRLSELNLLPGERDLRRRAARLLRIHEEDILELKIVRRAVDARKKPQVRLVYTVDVAVKGNEEAILNRCPKAKKPRRTGIVLQRPVRRGKSGRWSSGSARRGCLPG